MEIFRTSDSLNKTLTSWRSEHPDGIVGFVATMGALHDGHVTLVEAAKKVCDIVVVSVFVNPTQFNKEDDLKRYPRTEAADAKLLSENGCDIMFSPSVEDMYPPNQAPYEIDLKGLDLLMEGEFRPGHFKGVCNIVERLFKLIEPQKAFFGIKDLQQVAIVSHMVKVRQLTVEIVACSIKRSDSGLALSSRNALLTDDQKEKARIINWTLRIGKQLVSEGKTLEVIKENMLAMFALSDLDLEYLEIVDNASLQTVIEVQPNISACIAAYCGKVRLIDNIQLN